ncbi:hypothetical protein CO705_15845 [Ralstonia pickettii]|nr:hypothetical protein CO705_15845 [Ralstonia pickettii]
MTLLQNDPLTQLAFSIYENKGVFAVLIGSGLSRAAQIPTGWEITLDLIRRVASAQGEGDQPDWAAWYRSRTGAEPNYSTLLEDLGSTPAERRAVLHSYIEPTPEDIEQGRKVPTAAHRSIARLVAAGYIRVIITTNFDRLMENALRDEGVEPTVVSSVDALAGAEPLTHSRCYVLKLHGDYKDARILNTDEELSTYPDAYNTLLDRIFDEHGLIVCGWSGEWDHALRAAMLRAPNRRYPVFWATRGSPGDGAQQLIAHRHARVIEIAGADEFFEGVQQRVSTLERSRQQNPDSIELLVAATKRFLSAPEYRIDLEDLFARELSRLQSKLDAEKLPAQGQFTQEEFRRRVALYEALTEPLGRIAGVAGRWGDGRDWDLIVNVIHSLYRSAQSVQDGLLVYLGLRSYPAVLVFTAYGIGLVRAGRWDILYRLFSYLIDREGREPKRLVETLFAQVWSGSYNNVFQQLEGLERHHTPLSDRLASIMEQWRRSFIGVDADFPATFDRFELLACLSFLDKYTEEQLAAAESSQNGYVVRMPVGRFVWHTSTWLTNKTALEDASQASGVLAAGFAKGSQRFMQLFLRLIEQREEKMW